jgi:hypothetical protein
MLYVISGLIVAGAGSAGLLYFKPRNGRVHPLAVMPVLNWLLPTLIVGMLVFGAGLIVSGLI